MGKTGNKSDGMKMYRNDIQGLILFIVLIQ